jgi:hypothetical protein
MNKQDKTAVLAFLNKAIRDVARTKQTYTSEQVQSLLVNIKYRTVEAIDALRQEG